MAKAKKIQVQNGTGSVIRSTWEIKENTADVAVEGLLRAYIPSQFP